MTTPDKQQRAAIMNAWYEGNDALARTACRIVEDDLTRYINSLNDHP